MSTNDPPRTAKTTRAGRPGTARAAAARAAAARRAQASAPTVVAAPPDHPTIGSQPTIATERGEPTIGSQPTVATERAVERPDPELLSRLTAVWGQVGGVPTDPGQTVRTVSIGAVAPNGVSPRPRNVVEPVRGAPRDPTADYELGAIVGQGGMGVVKRARQAALGRLIAVKVLRGEHGDRADVRSNFLAEAAVTAELDHPGIVPVHDLGIDPAGRPFYAMKLVKGVPWSQVIDQKSQIENLEILQKVCDAIAYAHSKGVLHRDLKPDNIMVGEFGEVLVLDWGLAAAIGPGSRARLLDQGSRIAGTPSYMAPEMALGEIARIGVWSDVYLLGGMLYRIIAGHAPHPGADTRVAVLAAARNEIPPVGAGGELLAIALRAMDAEPERRHQSVRELQADLRSYQEHHESIALGRGAGEDLERAQDEGSYDLYARAVSAFREALRLWDGNAVAQVGLEAARLGYARLAFSRGDLDLAESLLDSPQPDAKALLAQVRSANQARRHRLLRMRRLRLAAIALGGCLLLAVAGGALLALRANRAEGERDQERLHALEAELTAKRVESEAAQRTRIRAQALDPYAKGMDLLMRGPSHCADAAKDLRAALAIDDGFAEAHFALGEALRISGQPHLAIASYLRSDELTQQASGQPNLQALVLSALASLDAFDYRHAESILARIEASGRTDPLALAGIAIGQRNVAKVAESLKTARRAVEQGPTLWETHLSLGLLGFFNASEGSLDPQEQLPLAIASLRRAYELSPRQPVVRIFLVRALRMSAVPADQALLASLSSASLEADEHPVLRVDRVLTLASEGKLDEAKRELERARSAGGPPAVLAYGEAAIARAAQDPERAFDLIKGVIAEHGENPALVSKWIALGLRTPSRKAEAVAYFNRWQASNMIQPFRFLIAAMVAVANGDAATAERELAAGSKMAPFNAEFMLVRIDLLRRAKRWDDVLSTVAPLIAQRPREFELRLVELEALGSSGKLPQALQRLSDLERDFPDRAADIARLKAKLARGMGM